MNDTRVQNITFFIDIQKYNVLKSKKKPDTITELDTK